MVVVVVAEGGVDDPTVSVIAAFVDGFADPFFESRCVSCHTVVVAITAASAVPMTAIRRIGHLPAAVKRLLTIVTARPERRAPMTPPRTQFLPDTA